MTTDHAKTMANPWATGTKEWQMYEDQTALRDQSQTTGTGYRPAEDMKNV